MTTAITVTVVATFLTASDIYNAIANTISALVLALLLAKDGS